MIFSVFIITWCVGTLTFAPVYLVNVKGFTPTEMSYIMAVLGIGAVVWGMVIPGLSDRFGRKPMLIIFSLLSVFSSFGFLLASSFASISVLAFIGWCGSGVFGIYQAAISGESVDVKYFSTAVAVIIMIGEVFGAFIGMTLAGAMADLYGLYAALIFSGCCAVVAGLVAFAYYETAPLALARRNMRKEEG